MYPSQYYYAGDPDTHVQSNFVHDEMDVDVSHTSAVSGNSAGGGNDNGGEGGPSTPHVPQPDLFSGTLITPNNFVNKLYQTVSDPKFAQFISWTEPGTSFVVPNVTEFSRSVLGSQFKYNNFFRFVRELNAYNFRRINRTSQSQRGSSPGVEPWEFSHPNFLRRRPDLLEKIKRKTTYAHPMLARISQRPEPPDGITDQLAAMEHQNRWTRKDLELERNKVDRLTTAVKTIWNVVERISPGGLPALEELGLVLDPPTTQEITYANSLTIANQGFRTRSTPALAASRGASRDSHSRSASPEASGPFHSPRRSSRTHGETNKTRSSFLVLLFAILEYPPFNEVIHWDGPNRVVLKQPQLLESYILMPVFGLRTLAVFKRRLYMFGFDCVPHQALGQNAHPDVSTWEHPTITKLDPPMGFTSRDWSEEIVTDRPTPDETILKEVPRLRGPIPVPISVDGGKTLDWSRHAESENVAHAPVYLNPIVLYERKLVAIRLGANPKVLEIASKVAGDLRRRYDLLFFLLETPKPVRLTAAVRWGISNSRIPTHAWKSPVPTQVIEDHLADKQGEQDDRPAPSTPEDGAQVAKKDWVKVVNKFISGYDHLDKMTESEPRFSRSGRPAVRSRASSRASSISEGHVSPEDDGPSKKVVCYDG